MHSRGCGEGTSPEIRISQNGGRDSGFYGNDARFQPGRGRVYRLSIRARPRKYIKTSIFERYRYDDEGPRSGKIVRRGFIMRDEAIKRRLPPFAEANV